MSDQRGSLRGMRILVLRTEGQEGDMAQALASEGAQPIAVPAIRVLSPRDPTSLERGLDDVRGFDWLVFTSVNGVASFFDTMAERGMSLDLGTRGIAAIGPKTREALQDRGVTVDWMPSRFNTETLAAEFPGPPSKVCLIRAENAGRELEESLRSRGFPVVRVDAYRSEPANAEAIKDAVGNGVDAIAFTSASIVDSFVRAAGTDTGTALVCSIGPATSANCRRMGLAVDVEAADHTSLGLVEAIRDHVEGSRSEKTRT